MSVTLPVLPLGNQTTIAINTNAAVNTPTMGGPSQRIARLGDRWSASVQCRSMSYAQGLAFIATLNQGLNDKVLFPVPQPGLTIGSPGTPTVTSGSGTSISLSGFTPGYVIHAGQYFSLVHNGVRYLHQVVSQVTATGGTASLTINPMLKVAPNNGDTCEFAQPYLEGFLNGNSQAWTISQVTTVGLGFAVTEAQ